DCHSVFILREWVIEGMLFFAPNVEGGHASRIQDSFLFRTFRKDLVELISGPVEGAVAMKRDEASDSKKRKHHNAHAGGDADDSKRRRINRSKAKKDIMELARQSTLQMSVDDGGNRRELNVFDDVTWQIFGPLDGLSKADLNVVNVREALSAVIRFIFSKATKFENVEYDLPKYSVLRPKLREGIAKTHLDNIIKLKGNPASSSDNPLEDVLRLVEKNSGVSLSPDALGADAQSAPASAPRDIVAAAFSGLLQDFEWIFGLVDFLKMFEVGPCDNPRLNHLFIKIMEAGNRCMLEATKLVSTDMYVDCFAGILKDLFQDMWQSFLNILGAMIAGGPESFDKYALGVIETREFAVKVFHMRAALVVEALASQACGQSRIAEKGMQSHVEVLRLLLNGGALGLMDLSLTEAEYRSAWLDILRACGESDSAKALTDAAKLGPSAILEALANVIPCSRFTQIGQTPFKKQIASVGEVDNQGPQNQQDNKKIDGDKGSDKGAEKPEDSNSVEPMNFAKFQSLSALRAGILPGLDAPLSAPYHCCTFAEQ
ncbi:unnamed protein product, partial [Prorocentrum cordatum]